MSFTQNEIFTLAADIISNTGQSVFLTGKAGTGKTTFLHHIKNTIDKNMVVAAPTGVAAINAGGVTLHSLLQLPFDAFIPNYEGKKKLDYHLNLRKSKIEMLQELELLIIDEVSMLRADMLDAIDYMLRRYRNSSQPFGGVQMLFIGDLFQLPPVVQQREWEELRAYYASPFFFHAQALNDNRPLYIELKTIYRQSDQEFIGILNRIRNNQTSPADLATLNKRYHPDFRPQTDDRYITLCTHNSSADKINKTELRRLTSKEFNYKGSVDGDFGENAYPTDLSLDIKEGAQIMFIKNDSGENRRYYNGKLATISYLDKDKIFVQFHDKSEMELERETWRNVRYTLNKKTGDIQEEEIGHFSQYPIRLAWAITIHKSQGLTFDRVIIDAGRSFAAGQVYVALSRCTSMEGIVLYSQILPQSIHTDNEAIRYSSEERSTEYLEQVLVNEQANYCAQRLKKSFEWSSLLQTLALFSHVANEKKIPDKDSVLTMIVAMRNRALQQEEIATNFCKEINRILLGGGEPDMQLLKERVSKASGYFHNDIIEHMLNPINDHLTKIKNVARIKVYQREVLDTQAAIITFADKLENIHYGNINLTTGIEYRPLHQMEEVQEAVEAKPKKGDTKRITLDLFRQGKPVDEIAKERNLVRTTIESHLVSFIPTGEVQIEQLMTKQKVTHLEMLLADCNWSQSLKEIKDKLPKEYTYLDMKAMQAYLCGPKKKYTS